MLRTPHLSNNSKHLFADTEDEEFKNSTFSPMSILSVSGKASTNDKCTGVVLETSISLNKSEHPGTLLWRDRLRRHKTSVASADNASVRSAVPHCGKKGQDVWSGLGTPLQTV